MHLQEMEEVADMAAMEEGLVEWEKGRRLPSAVCRLAVGHPACSSTRQGDVRYLWTTGRAGRAKPREGKRGRARVARQGSQAASGSAE